MSLLDKLLVCPFPNRNASNWPILSRIPKMKMLDKLLVCPIQNRNANNWPILSRAQNIVREAQAPRKILLDIFFQIEQC